MTKETIKRNVMMILAASMLIAVGLAREQPTGLPSEVYLATVLTESGEDLPDTDEFDADELGLNEPELDALEPEEPESYESEPDFEEVATPPTTETEINMQGTQPDLRPPVLDIVAPESNPEEPELEPEPESEASEVETSEPEISEPETSETSEAAEDEFILGFASMPSNEAVVKTYTDLKNALENDNGITTVYFGADIVMQDGIKINSKKTAITIVGFNPLESGQSKPYRLTDLDSASFYDTIYVDEAGTKSIHVQDLAITGKNFYSPFGVYDMASLAGFVTTYERVDYNGPQMCYNRRGTVRLIDCSAKIHGDNGILSPHQEFSEVKHLIFDGINSIDTVTNLYSVFWHPFGGTFTISDDASLTLTSPNTSAAFGVFFADSYLYDLDISIGTRAVLDMTISGFVAPELYVTLTGMTVHEGGAFYLKTTATATAVVLRIGGPLTVEKDAKFIISGYGGASFPVLRQESGDIKVGKDAIFQITANNPYTSLLNLIGRAFICDNPLSVLLVNANRDIQASIAAGRVSVSAQQLNYWNTPSSGGLDNPPLYKWTKADRSNVTVDGTLAFAGASDFTSLTTNHLPTDPPQISPSTTTFRMTNARVLAFGRLSLIVSAPTAGSGTINGVTEAGAVVRASFTQQGQSYTLPDAVAASDGSFHIPAGTGLQSGTVVTVRSSWQYLTAEAEVMVADEGRLVLFVPDILEFYTTPLSASAKTVKRVNPEWKIIVSDTRGYDSKWDLYARLDEKMTPAAANLPALEDALIFVDSSGRTETMYPGDDILIARHTPKSGEEVFPVIWEDNKGMLLTVKPGSAFSDTEYTATIAWTIVDGV